MSNTNYSITTIPFLLLATFSANSYAESGYFELSNTYDFNLSIDLSKDDTHSSQLINIPIGIPQNIAKFVNRTFELNYDLGPKKANLFFPGTNLLAGNIISEEKLKTFAAPTIKITSSLESVGKLTLIEGLNLDTVFTSDPLIIYRTSLAPPNTIGSNIGLGDILYTGSSDEHINETINTISSNKTSRGSTIKIDLDLTKKSLPFIDTSYIGNMDLTGTLVSTNSYKLWSITPETQITLQNTASVVQHVGDGIGIAGSIFGFGTGVGPGKFNTQIVLSALNDLNSSVSGVKSLLSSDTILSNANAASIQTEVASYVSSYLVSPPKDPAGFIGFSLNSFALLSHSAAVGLAYLGTDPPDSNYKALTALNYFAISPRPNASQTELAFTKAATDMINFSDALRASTSSLEKYQGAIAANDFGYAKLQLDNFNINESIFLSTLNLIPKDIKDFKDSLNQLDVLDSTPNLKLMEYAFLELKSNPSSITDFEKFLALYYPGAELNKELLLSIDTDTFLSTFIAGDYSSTTIGGELDLLAKTYSEFDKNYNPLMSDPSPVPLPNSFSMMALGLLGLLIIYLFRNTKTIDFKKVGIV